MKNSSILCIIFLYFNLAANSFDKVPTRKLTEVGHEGPYLSEAAHVHFRARVDVTQYWHGEIIKNRYTAVADIGPGGMHRRFPHANVVVDYNVNMFAGFPNVTAFQVDIDSEKVPVEDYAFDFVYSRHILEDVNNPIGAFREMTRLARRGYIETPSPYMELTLLGPPPDDRNLYMPGFLNHRFLFWTDTSSNTLYGIPKYPIINGLPIPIAWLQQGVDSLSANGPFCNNYYEWDLDDEQLLPKVVILKDGVDYNVEDVKSYGDAILNGGALSMSSTVDFFARRINPFVAARESRNDYVVGA